VGVINTLKMRILFFQFYMCIVDVGIMGEKYIKSCFSVTPCSSGKKPCKDIGIAACSAEVQNNTSYHLLKYSNKTTWHTSIAFLFIPNTVAEPESFEEW